MDLKKLKTTELKTKAKELKIKGWYLMKKAELVGAIEAIDRQEVPKPPENLCPHSCIKYSCRYCGGSQYCKHGRREYFCKECGGNGICIHWNNKHYCKECGGKQICEHGRVKYICKECGGKGICEHGWNRRICKDCKDCRKTA